MLLQKQNRLQNLRLLHGIPPTKRAPRSNDLVDFLESRGVELSNQKLSEIYAGAVAIDDETASSIQTAFDLPDGWLDCDQSFWLKVSPTDLEVFKDFAALSEDTKFHLAKLVQILKLQP